MFLIFLRHLSFGLDGAFNDVHLYQGFWLRTFDILFVIQMYLPELTQTFTILQPNLHIKYISEFIKVCLQIQI